MHPKGSLVVSDSSTLILIVKSDFHKVVLEEFNIFIPKIVFEEIVVKGKEKNFSDAFIIEKNIEKRLIKVREPPEKLTKKIQEEFKLFRGERDAIALALALKADLILTDDLKAMRVCSVLSLNFSFALAVLYSFYENKKISKKDYFDCLLNLEVFGWYNPKIIRAYKIKGGEKI